MCNWGASMCRRMVFMVRSFLFMVWFCSVPFLGLTAICDAAETGAFTGSWSATGTREVLEFGSQRQAALFKLQGHVNLKDNIGQIHDYWSKCIGLTDTATGSEIRCVWTGAKGQNIYVVLKAEKLEQGTMVTGEFVGGTKAASGITGSLTFNWSTLFIQKSGNTESVGGYAKELKGSYSLP